MPAKVLADLRRRLDPLARSSSPLSEPPPRETRFGSPLVLSRVHWVKPQLVAEITYLLGPRTGACGKWLCGGPVRQASPCRLRRSKPLSRRDWLTRRQGVGE